MEFVMQLVRSSSLYYPPRIFATHPASSYLTLNHAAHDLVQLFYVSKLDSLSSYDMLELLCWKLEVLQRLYQLWVMVKDSVHQKIPVKIG